MARKHTSERCAAARLELLEALIEDRGALLMEATAAGCAIVAHADGEVVPAETRRLLSVMRTDPLLSMFPQDAVLAEFAGHARALVHDLQRGRANALLQIMPLASHPRLARVVLEACLAVTRADGLVHPREVEAVRLVRDALGLSPEPGGAPEHPARHASAPLQQAAV